MHNSLSEFCVQHLFQLRYIIFTCILHANARQQLHVVRLYVGCIKIHTFYFLFYAEQFCSVICGVCLCRCDVCQNATVSFLGRDNNVILNLEYLHDQSKQEHYKDLDQAGEVPTPGSAW